MSGVIGKATVMDSTKPGGLGGTYGGNPVACAAALATIAAIEDEGLVERSVRLGNRLVARLNEIKAREDVPAIGNVRGSGLMVAFELVKEPGGNEPNPDLVGKLTAKAAEKGLILLSCGYFANTIRLLVPLTIPESQLEEVLDIIEGAYI